MDLIEPAADIGGDYLAVEIAFTCLVIGILVNFIPWPIIGCISCMEHGSIALRGS